MDLEAVADDEYEEEEEEEVIEDEFMAGMWNALKSFFHLTHFRTLEDEYDTTDEPHSAFHRSITQANEEHTLEAQFQELEERSHWRSRNSRRHTFQAIENVGYQLQETDILWEIGCKVSFAP